jgi:hypothetical protein
LLGIPVRHGEDHRFDETHPKLVSQLMLEVNEANSAANPTKCQTQFQDFISTGGFLYDAHYCTADDPKNAKMVACSYMQSGVRIFDVRNPYLPKEVAYYKPPASGTRSVRSRHCDPEP